jgi:hypothetical protein
MDRKTIVAACIIALATTSCISMTPSQRGKLRELEQYGISKEEQKIKHPALAGVLNLLPGFGNFYLAAGTDESSQWAFGFLNLLVWPYSVVWGMPQAAIDASTINKKETLYYYTTDRQGRKELAYLKAEQDGYSLDATRDVQRRGIYDQPTGGAHPASLYGR